MKATTIKFQPKAASFQPMLDKVTTALFADVSEADAILIERMLNEGFQFELKITKPLKKHSIDWSQVAPQYNRIVTIDAPSGKRHMLRGEHPSLAPQTRADSIASFVAGDLDDTVYRPS